MSEWSHLPNAAHIDRIIVDLALNTKNWAEVWPSTCNECQQVASKIWVVRNAFRDAALSALNTLAWSSDGNTARSSVRSSDNQAAVGAARYPITALIAWPESAEYLSLPRDQVQVMAALGDQRAILMLPAVMAFAKSRELA